MRFISALIFSSIAVVCTVSLTQAADEKVERGKYLVEEVAKCQDCHTPRATDGTLDKDKWLKGATLDFAPMHEVPGWHKTSPDLTASSRLFERWQAKGITEFL